MNHTCYQVSTQFVRAKPVLTGPVRGQLTDIVRMGQDFIFRAMYPYVLHGGYANHRLHQVTAGVSNLQGVLGLAALNSGAQWRKGDFATVFGAHKGHAAWNLLAAQVQATAVKGDGVLDYLSKWARV